MKTLIFNNEEYQAEKIVKTNTDIIGYNGETETFAFRGVNDFSQFQLEEGQNFDVDEKSAELEYLIDLDFRLSMIELEL